MNSDFVPIGQASKILGVSIQTLRNWEKTGRLLPDFVSAGRTRRYSRRRLLSITGLTNSETKEDQKVTIAYARVSTNEQKEDLSRQIELLELFCAKNGFTYEVISQGTPWGTLFFQISSDFLCFSLKIKNENLKFCVSRSSLF